MYVCICKGITEQQVTACVNSGASGVRDLYQQLNLGSQCGKCIGFARQVLVQAQTNLDLSYDAAANS